MRTCLTILFYLTFTLASMENDTETRQKKLLSLFSIVQFPNEECTSTSSSTTIGTCFTSSECTSKSGTAEGNCAAGFGVCCVISTTTCGATITTNTSYIRNPGYPSSYTASTTGTCSYTIKKVSDDICQLRLDFQQFDGFALASPATGACEDTFAAAGQTGKNPPTICGTNTGYHMYVEFGTASTDSVTLTNTWATNGLSTAKNYNILARQIPCSATYKAPTDCVQYFTGISGNVQNYNFKGDTYINNQEYNNCIRTEKGYCSIQWKESSATSPDAFQIGTGGAIDATGCVEFINIPNLSPNGISPTGGPVAFQSNVCGNAFGVEGGVAGALVSAQTPFILGVKFGAVDTSGTANTNGFNMDYTQLPC